MLSRFLSQRLEAVVPAHASVCVGLSGGLDSIVLADLLAEVSAPRSLSAVHVHHGLSPNADAWAGFCERFCAERRIALAVVKVEVDRASPDGLEAAARAARYAVYAARTENFVALAHHLDDQAETILLQLLRGTGLKGVAAMPELRALPTSRVRLFRPFLAVPRSELLECARSRNLQWIEDESNAITGHDRNFVRHEVSPRLDARFDGWREAFERFARHAASADQLLKDLARVDGLPAAAGVPLPLNRALGPERRANLLRAYLALNDVAMPSEARLAEMARQLFDARSDAQIAIEHAGVTLRRKQAEARIDRDSASAGAPERPWNGEPEMDLGEGRGRVAFETVVGEGIAAARASGPGWRFASRNGGERIQVDSRRPTRTLKNLLQESDIPAWERDSLPLLFHNDQLVWVPGVGIAVEYACAPGEPGLRPVWKHPGKAS